MSDFYFWVYVYPTVTQMRKDIKKYDAKCGAKQPDSSDALGVVNSYVRELVSSKGKVSKRKKDIGIIRLAKRYVSTVVVSHEVVHAAMWNFRIAFGIEHEWEGSVENACFGNNCSPTEEDFAYLYCQLFSDMTRKLYDNKIWQ